MHTDEWMLILPQCSEAHAYLKTNVAENMYNLIYTSAPFVLLCMVGTCVMQLAGSSDRDPLILRLPVLSVAALMCWPQNGVVSKSLSLCTGVAAGHLLQVSVHRCMLAGEWVCKLRMQATSQGKKEEAVDGSRISATLIVILPLTVIHVFLGLLASTVLLACSIVCAKAAIIQRDESLDQDISGEDQAQDGKESKGPGFSTPMRRARHQGDSPSTSYVGQERKHTTSDCTAGTLHPCMHSVSSLDRCGHHTVCLALMSTLLALPSAVAAARSSWSQQALEDILPAVSVVVWACLLSSSCYSERHRRFDHTQGHTEVAAPSTASQQHCGGSFTQLACSQVRLACSSVLLTDHAP